MSAQQLASSSKESIPTFKVWADQGTHPPVALEGPVCVIGRREIGVNLPLHAPQVSKMHALVVRDQRRVYLRDLASTNGVHHNGAPVLEAGLSDKDVLRIGSYTLRCDSGFSPAVESLDDSAAASEKLAGDVPPAAALRTASGQTFPFPPDRHTLLIGRREGCDVRLDDESVAPVHAVVFQLDGTRHVRELGKPGRTSINGRPIHQHALAPGDELGFGSAVLRYELIADVEIEPLLDAPPPDLDELDVAAAAVVSLEDSRAPGTPDLGPGDSSMIEPAPQADASFHGEIVVGPEATSPSRSAMSLTEPPPTIAQQDDELIEPSLAEHEVANDPEPSPMASLADDLSHREVDGPAEGPYDIIPLAPRQTPQSPQTDAEPPDVAATRLQS